MTIYYITAINYEGDDYSCFIEAPSSDAAFKLWREHAIANLDDDATTLFAASWMPIRVCTIPSSSGEPGVKKAEFESYRFNQFSGVAP